MKQSSLSLRSDLARFGRGFVYAWHGVCAAVRQERNFRFHLCAALYVYAAAWYAGLDAVGVALVSVCVFAMLGMELMNSAVERAVDQPDAAHWTSAGAAKDMAAGAVLAVAVGTVAVGVCLFGNAQALTAVWRGVTASPASAVCWAASLFPAYWFVFRLGRGTQPPRTEAVSQQKENRNAE